MKKDVVTFDQLTAGALLKFGKLDSVDMTLLMYEISKVAKLEQEPSDSLDKYFLLVDGSIILNDKYVEDVYKISNKKLLESMQGSIVKKFFDELDILEFVLRKIKLLGKTCVVEEINNNFSIIQRNVINELYELGCIENYIQEEMMYGDYEAIRLTQKGKLVLFTNDNQEEVKSFISLLRTVGYGYDYINKFLLVQDFDKSSSEILSSSNFGEFRKNYDEVTSTKLKKVRISFDK